ncbi:MAG: hypothetical protein EOP08_15280, partial [Proteobacteria bacterium]
MPKSSRVPWSSSTRTMSGFCGSEVDCMRRMLNLPRVAAQTKFVPVRDPRGEYAGSTVTTSLPMLTILDALDTPVAILTAEERIEWVNTAGAAWLGSTPADLAGQTFVERLAPAGRAHVGPLLGRAGAGERSDVEYDGRPLTVLPFRGGCALLLGRTPSDHDEQSLATIGHDLRTPLLNLSLAANVLRQSGHDVSVDVGELVAEAGQRLQRLTRDLVDFTRVRLGLERPLSRHAVDVNALARTAIESVHDTFPSTPIELQCIP